MHEGNSTTVGSAVELPLEHLDSEITALNAHLSAATCRFLLLVAEFDRRRVGEVGVPQLCALPELEVRDRPAHRPGAGSRRSPPGALAGCPGSLCPR